MGEEQTCHGGAGMKKLNYSIKSTLVSTSIGACIWVVHNLTCNIFFFQKEVYVHKQNEIV